MPANYTVGTAVNDWLQRGLRGRDEKTTRPVITEGAEVMDTIFADEEHEDEEEEEE